MPIWFPEITLRSPGLVPPIAAATPERNYAGPPVAESRRRRGGRCR